jgi:hypothetical protein
MEKQIKHFYVRDCDRNPICLVAYEESKQSEGEHEIRYATAIRNPKDKFDRKLAHHIANGRLEKSASVVCLSLAEMETPMYAILEDISLESSFSARVRQNAQLMLISLKK